MGRRIKYIRRVARIVAPVSLAATVLLFVALDHLFPLPLQGDTGRFAVAVVAEDGTPLRGFPDDKGVWRYPVRLEDVSPLYVEALVNYEDRWFWYHPGVNPWALARALVLWQRHGHPVSGGSTLTMQTARIIDPHTRTVRGKLKQIFQAFQLEWHLSKKEIIELYLNYAPFGGVIEGVQAAGYAYLGKPVRELSHAEACLLAVLPQAPSRLRPDRHPDRARAARDKVLRRLVRFGVWDKDIVKRAGIENVAPRFNPRPMCAPLLARRVRRYGGPDRPVRTTVDVAMQEAAADMVWRFVAPLPEQTSAAVMIVENRTMAVRAYVGSADFLDDSRYGHVDMIWAERSPGSTLKPFLYAMAMEEGLIHSESLLVDAPFTFAGYRPGNFTQGFSGPVSAAEALRRSLNIPAVDLLDRLGPRYFDARLRQGGLHLRYPAHGGPNLSMILGGAGVSLEALVSAYTALARDGLSGKPRFLTDEPVKERRLLEAGSAFIVRRILQDHQRSDLPAGAIELSRSRQVAWKTGTSYGHRDAWAIGVTDDYTVGVWVGRPDGTPSPGQHGRGTAAPLLFLVIDSLPRGNDRPPPVPDTVRRIEICWPLGIEPAGPDDALCHQRRRAWVLNGVVPPTLPDRTDKHWLPNPMTVFVNPDTGLRVEPGCAGMKTVKRTIARWPRMTGPWLNPYLRGVSAIPPLDPGCGRAVSTAPANIEILNLEPGTVVRPQGADTRMPTIALQAMGGREALFWLLNGRVIARSGIGETRYHRFRRSGDYRLTVMDLAGNHDSVDLSVMKGNPDG